MKEQYSIKEAETEEIRKTINYNSRNIPRNTMEISIVPRSGGIYFYMSLCKKLNLKIGDALMFSINKHEQIAYFYKETPSNDNYILKKQNEYVLRINNKILTNLLVRTFNLPNSRTYLNVDIIPDNKNRYKIYKDETAKIK